MTLAELVQTMKPDAVGVESHTLLRRLYPICRSLTGQGVRDTLTILRERIPLTIEEVASGTPAFDWTVPKEWNIRDAYIADTAGRRVIDFRAHNLHVMSYSTPVHRRMPVSELREHLFTLPEHPDWIPYRTSYYKPHWAFCVTQRQADALADSEYDVCIDSTLEDGSLTYGECVLPGTSSEEVLISCHICHPSLCNDNLSGIVAATALAARLAGVSRRYTYRFLFVPGTIGSIVWLSRHEDTAARIRHGLTLACVGDPGGFTYKKSRRGDAVIDRAVAHTLAHQPQRYAVTDFSPYGYDERQYSSPGFNLPVGCFMRTPHGTFPEYHTSADNPDFVTAEALGGSVATLLAVMRILEENRVYLNTNPKCEPQLGKRGLYRAVGGTDGKAAELALLWVLNQADGHHALLDIAERAKLPWDAISRAAEALKGAGLLQELEFGQINELVEMGEMP